MEHVHYRAGRGTWQNSQEIVPRRTCLLAPPLPFGSPRHHRSQGGPLLDFSGRSRSSRPGYLAKLTGNRAASNLPAGPTFAIRLPATPPFPGRAIARLLRPFSSGSAVGNARAPARRASAATSVARRLAAGRRTEGPRSAAPRSRSADRDAARSRDRTPAADGPAAGARAGGARIRDARSRPRGAE